jgi:hypothetical protein
LVAVRLRAAVRVLGRLAAADAERGVVEAAEVRAEAPLPDVLVSEVL